MSAVTEARSRALEEFEARRRTAPVPIDNASLPAGSPMHFYCRDCGHESDVLPEGYTNPPVRHCGPCLVMRAMGWLPR